MGFGIVEKHHFAKGVSMKTEGKRQGYRALGRD